MPQFEVVAEKLWHSTECRFYVKGDTVNLPEGTKPSDAIREVEAKSVGKTKAPAKGEGDSIA